MAEVGLHTVADLARATGIAYPTLVGYVSFKTAPYTQAGDLRPAALKVCEVLLATPEELWPPQHLETPMRKNMMRFELSAADLQCLLDTNVESPEALMLASGQDALIESALSSLTPKEERIIRLRYGIADEKEHTADEVAELFGVSRNRIYQLEHRALRKLRHPARAKELVQQIPWLENAISRRPDLRHLVDESG
jgi:RNA polymerase sigma factor (sigma-70 family)